MPWRIETHRQRRHAELMVLEEPFQVQNNHSQTHRLPNKMKALTWKPCTTSDEDDEDAALDEERIADAVAEQVNLGQEQVDLGQGNRQRSADAPATSQSSNELADGVLSEGLGQVSKLRLKSMAPEMMATTAAGQDGDGQREAAVRTCFDLGVLVRQALQKHMLEKDEQALLRHCAEWVAISRQASVISLSTTENNDTASVTDSDFVML